MPATWRMLQQLGDGTDGTDVVDVQGSKYIDKNRWLMNINDHYKYKPL